MNKYNRKSSVVASGHKEGNKKGRKVVCLFDDDLFVEVRDRAVEKGIPFAQSVRELVNAGILYEGDE